MISAYFREGHPRHVRAFSALAVSFFAVFLVSYNALFQPPRDFPVGGSVSIEDGMTLDSIASLLKERSIVRSPALFKSFVIFMAGDKGALSGDYYFNVPLNGWEAASRISRGKFGLDPVKITFPEGLTVSEIAQALDEALPSFDEEEFLKLAREEEGYLFPDTYLFLPNVKPAYVLKEMKRNFSQKMEAVHNLVQASGKTQEEIIIMASILEKEAITVADKELISGILWKRIQIGMPLQVDAPFAYAIGKNTFQLTLDDLNADSPYNTYKNLGLPAGPIANPGLESIRAALMPQESPYFFYLSDRKFTMHYAVTFEEHKRNKSLHLN